MTREEQDRVIAEIVEAQHRLLPWVLRQLGTDAEDVLAQAQLVAVEVVRSGTVVLNPACFGYGILRNGILQFIQARQRERARTIPQDLAPDVAAPELNPEQQLLQAERDAKLAAIDEAPHELDRQVLRRFYLDEQPAAQIQSELGLSDTQFRLRKSRAKGKIVKAAGVARRRADLICFPCKVAA